MKGIVNKIIKNSFIDGPGNRMVIFFQGCNLRCKYCHNPETQQVCINCGTCVKNCENGALSFINDKVHYNKDKCVGCERCVDFCPNNASPLVTTYDVDALFKLIQDKMDFIDGITVSGGECLLQYEFISSLFKKIKENTDLTTYLDTNGYNALEKLKKLQEYTDGFIIDLKAYNSCIHYRLTGAYNETILSGIQYISTLEKLMEVRTVIVEGYTDSKEEISNISKYIKGLNDYTRLKLIPFRNLGVKGELKNKINLRENIFNELFLEAQKILGKLRIVK